MEAFNGTKVNHLSRTGSDRAPLLVDIEKERSNLIRYFKFLNIWCNHKDFKDIVKEEWSRPVQGRAMWKVHCKLKAVARRLSSWSRETYGDIFRDSKEAEKEVKELEKKHTENNNEETRSSLNKEKAEYIRLLKNQYEIYRKRAKERWLQDGDKNSPYFHKVIKDRRRKLNIHKISDNEGNNIEGHQNIADAAIKHFEELFKYEEIRGSFRILDKVSQVVTADMNTMQIARPTAHEVTDAINNIESDSAPGPDGFGAKFFQTCIDIIFSDIHNAILEFCDGTPVPRYVSHTCLFMLPKCPQPQSFSDIRPISLCNTLSKIIAKILSNRIGKILPDIISPNQSGFIQGRSITDNVLLAQELVQDIPKTNKHDNLVLKVDMSKAYDRVSWPNLCRIMRKLGFNEIWIDIIYKHIANNWYSIVLNGTRNGFFKSSRGLRSTNKQKDKLCSLFSEGQSGSRIKINYFSEMVNSITSRIHSWHTKFLSKGGKIVLIKHVLSAMLVHLLAAMKPPKGTFEQIESAMIRFLWSDKESMRKYHWSSWEAMCLPGEEGGVGLRCLSDVSNAFTAKQWWNLRTKDSLWKEYMMSKYCSTRNPVIRKVIGVQSLTWRSMCKVRDQIEDNFTWQIGQGHLSFWYDNWSRNGALYKLLPEEVIPNNSLLNEVDINGNWIWNRVGLGEEYVQQLEQKHDQQKHQIHKMVPLPPHYVKLNSNGSCKGSACRGRGIIKDEKGKMISAYSINLGCGTNNWLRLKPFNMDSNAIQGKCKTPWNIEKMVCWIQMTQYQYQFQIRHFFREANQVADKLAQISHSHIDVVTYTSFQDLPKAIRGVLNLDRWGLPSIRSRTRSNKSFTFDSP
ncbi:uncharacterized protein LOC132619937 [Lycium barbarum]|uniref:uncharacterized protein LOC132619937 n=1 Tax=Lycium barbarum TaxID=112863 RepID=UPI00293F0F45|nr:uncharacterized protein LOC132619937 [Lycium barbarum]